MSRHLTLSEARSMVETVFANYPEDKVDQILIKPGEANVRLRPDAREIKVNIVVDTNRHRPANLKP